MAPLRFQDGERQLNFKFVFTIGELLSAIFAVVMLMIMLHPLLGVWVYLLTPIFGLCGAWHHRYTEASSAAHPLETKSSWWRGNVILVSFALLIGGAIYYLGPERIPQSHHLILPTLYGAYVYSTLIGSMLYPPLKEKKPEPNAEYPGDPNCICIPTFAQDVLHKLPGYRNTPQVSKPYILLMRVKPTPEERHDAVKDAWLNTGWFFEGEADGWMMFRSPREQLRLDRELDVDADVP